MDARAATDVCGSSVRRSRVVLTPRCWRQVLEKQASWERRWQKSRSQEHEVSRKAIAQGRPECSRCPVCSCALLFAQIARETAGAASTRSSLRPLKKRAGSYLAKLAQMMRRDRERIFDHRHPRRRVTQYPRESVIEPRSRCILDTPHARGMTAEDDEGPSK